MSVPVNPVPTSYISGNCETYTAVSELFTFEIEPDCTRGYNQKQFMFKNRFGLYDYMWFKGSIEEGLGISRQNYKTWSVSWTDKLANLNKQRYDRGLTDADVSIIETHIVNTGFITLEEFQWLEELMTSSEVYIVNDDNQLRPVNVTNAEYVRKIENFQPIYNLEITYVYANNIALVGNNRWKER